MITRNGISIRSIAERDIELLYTIGRQKGRSCSYISLNNRNDYSLSDYKDLFPYIADRELIVYDNSINKPIMLLSYEYQSPSARRVSLSILIIEEISNHNPSYNRLIEGLTLIVEFFFLEQNINKITVSLIEDDFSIIFLVEAIGFKKEVHFQKQLYSMGKYKDIVLYGILMREYKSGGQ